METRGQLKDIGISFPARKAVITLEVTATPEQCETLKGQDLSVELKRYRQRRSRNANAYFHVLCNAIADARTLRGDPISKAHEKNELIIKYGQPLLVDGEKIFYKTNAPQKFMQELAEPHAQLVKEETENGRKVYFYLIFRGSRTYDTKEMAALIDGTIEDARECGVPEDEILTPDELARLKEYWRPEND